MSDYKTEPRALTVREADIANTIFSRAAAAAPTDSVKHASLMADLQRYLIMTSYEITSEEYDNIGEGVFDKRIPRIEVMAIHVAKKNPTSLIFASFHKKNLKEAKKKQVSKT